MVEGRAYTHGTLRAAQRRSERAGMAKLRTARRISSERRAGTAKYGPPSEGSGTLPQKVLARTARARASLRVVAARAPPGAPTLASHGPNVRCKKTNRATQRTKRTHINRGRRGVELSRGHPRKYYHRIPHTLQTTHPPQPLNTCLSAVHSPRMYVGFAVLYSALPTVAPQSMGGRGLRRVAPTLGWRQRGQAPLRGCALRRGPRAVAPCPWAPSGGGSLARASLA